MNGSAERSSEIAGKLARIRTSAAGKAVRLRGTDWFAWATAGGSSAVLLAAETGVAEIVITDRDAWIVTDRIEAQRLQDEELVADFHLHAAPWAFPRQRESFVAEVTRGAAVISDRPAPGEGGLPDDLRAAKRLMTPSEVQRYRQVGALAAEAMGEVLHTVQPDWTELRLAGEGAAALLARGLDPALVMAAGHRRLQRYRHPMPKMEAVGSKAMLVFCARGYGLYANLTRFVSFGKLSAEDQSLHQQVREVEARALAMSRPGVMIAEIYGQLQAAYASCGCADEISKHHQGGTTGYLSREALALPEATEVIGRGSVVAWNPSITGAKVEDTFLVHEATIENLTKSQDWPTIVVNGIQRPLVLERQ